MSKCENCIHKEVCNGSLLYPKAELNCTHFKDKSLFVELPCKEGETVYKVSKIECKDCPNIIERDCTFRKCPTKVVEEKFRLSRTSIDNIGKTVFLTKEEAERARGKEK